MLNPWKNIGNFTLPGAQANRWGMPSAFHAAAHTELTGIAVATQKSPHGSSREGDTTDLWAEKRNYVRHPTP